MKILARILILTLIISLCTCIFASCDAALPLPGGKDEDTELEGSGGDEGTGGDEGSGDEITDDKDKIPGEENYDIITIAEALELCGESGNITTERYYIKGQITSITNPAYGAMSISDATGTISVYGTYSADGSIGYASFEDKPYKGDTVILHCILQNFNGTKEVKNARLIAFKRAEADVETGDYTEMSIAQARDAVTDAKVKLQGTVAAITYSNGQKPAGVMLVDATGSIYAYDADLAGRCKVGDKITILGSKTYWVLDKEQTSADKFGYKGCCQIEDITFVSKDGESAEFDKSWITETTIKEILDTPVTENITSLIYKVNALVDKQEGTGFVNYYFHDLDEKTSSYTYTQCNGSDFSWLDEFDGKICTVYITAINAKSSSAGCIFRFLPIAVYDEGFIFDTDDTAEHVVDYYGIPQFNTSYTGNPEAELVTSVSSTLLGFTGATLSYRSSNEAIVYFTESDGKTYLNCADPGKATVTVKGEYNGIICEKTLEITVAANEDFDTITVSEAIASAVGNTVTIRGIVGPSVVNKQGFYLFDETGMIAVLVKDSAIFSEIEIGHEVVITAKRDCYKDAGKTHAGQTCLTDAEVVANYYGEHAYPDSSFITDKDLAYLYGLDVNEDHSTEVYVVTATVAVEYSSYYTKIKLTSGSISLTLYCSSANQYAFLQSFANQEVTLEIAPCNWNNKTYYAGCVLAVRTADGKIVNALNFQD